MSHYKIIGQQPLEGILEVAGAKNHALKVIAASVLSDEPMTIHRVPAIEDVRRLLEILTSMGADITSDEVAGTLRIDTSGLRDGLMPSELTRRIRASAVLIGPLLARFGKVVIPHPGGCLLGKRPIDLFIDGFKALGADVLEDEHSVTFTAHRLVGATIFMPVKSVTVTETLMMAATLADGITILKNAACEPEIPALAEYLNEHGARISGAGTHTIRIIGVSRLSAGLCRVIPDRLETGTFAILAAAARGNIQIQGCDTEYVGALLSLFDRIGVPYTCSGSTLHVDARAGGTFRATNVKTHEYPGLVTDVQAPLTVLLTQCEGLSLVHETIFEGRLFYTDKLNRMGASIILADPHRAIVQGSTTLRGKHLESPDIRAGIALLIAGLIAQGETRIDNIYQIERGYANIVERLKGIGTTIERIE